MFDRYPDDPEDRADLIRAARGGLCGVCRHARLVRSARGSVFALCTHPDLPKYPVQPVLGCVGFVAVSETAG